MPVRFGIEGYLDEQIRAKDLVGIQVSVSCGREPIRTYTAGFADADRTIPVTEASLFRIASISKLLTSALTFILSEKGLIDIQRPLSDFYPGIANAREITVAHLLNQTSGITDIIKIPEIDMEVLFHPRYVWKVEEILDILERHKPLSAPGTRYEYCNSNYFLLGLVLGTLSRRTVTGLFEDHLFKPAGMRNTFPEPWLSNPDGLVYGYDRDLLPFPGIYTVPPDNTAISSLVRTAGAFVSNSTDLVRAMDAIIRRDILSRETLKILTDSTEDRSIEGQAGYGYGLELFIKEEMYFYGHEGQYIGFRTLLAYLPAEDLIIALLINTTKAPLWEIALGITQITLQEKRANPSCPE